MAHTSPVFSTFAGMRFLNPQFLYGLLALAIPIIIHLFHFRKIRKVYFSNTRFLRKVKEESAHRRNLKHYLILFCRLCFIFFLVMAFAQPFLPASEDESAGVPLTIYLDNSFSMSNEVQEDQSALDQGVEYINTLLDVMPENTTCRLLTNDFLPSSNRMRTRNEIREELTELQYSGLARDHQEVINRIRAYGEEGKKNIFWISDFQSSRAAFQEPVVTDSSEQLQLVPLKFRSEANLSIDSVYLDNPLMIGDGQLQLFVVIRNSGNESIKDLIVKVYLDEIQSATGSIDIPAGSRATIQFDLSISMEATRRGRISIEDFPVTFDNDFYFSLSGPERIKILEIRGQEDITPVQQVYANPRLFDFVSFTSTNVDYNRIGLSDLVVLNGLPAPDGPLIAAINTYIDEGGHVMVIPAPVPDLSAYRKIRGSGDLYDIDSASSVPLAAPDYANPFFDNIFEEQSNRLAMPVSRPVLGWTNRGIHLLEFTSNAPYLTYRETRGGVFLVAAPFREGYDGFIRHALFVPVMYKIAARSMDHEMRLYRHTDEGTLVVRRDSLPSEGVYRLEREGSEIVPQQRIDQDQVHLDIPPNLIQSGFYDLTIDHNKIGLLAFNYPPEESDLRQAGEEMMHSWFEGPDQQIIAPETTTDFKADMESRFKGKPLWKWMILLALAALLGEVALIRFMS